MSLKVIYRGTSYNVLYVQRMYQDKSNFVNSIVYIILKLQILKFQPVSITSTTIYLFYRHNAT